MTDAAIHRVSGDVGGLSVRLLDHSGSPRAFSPRHDKREVRVGYGEPVDRHARKGLAMTRWRVRVGWWVTVDRHGLRPRDDNN